MARQFLSATFLATAIALSTIAILAQSSALGDFVGPPVPCKPLPVGGMPEGWIGCYSGGLPQVDCPVNSGCVSSLVNSQVACDCVVGALKPVGDTTIN